MSNETTSTLSLKWGTIKGWDNISPALQPLLEEYYKDGQPMSAMADRPDQHRREILCKIIDAHTGEIYLDWDGIYVDKEKAKEYVLNYDKR
jgi:hypothetical protein